MNKRSFIQRALMLVGSALALLPKLFERQLIVVQPDGQVGLNSRTDTLRKHILKEQWRLSRDLTEDELDRIVITAMCSAKPARTMRYLLKSFGIREEPRQRPV